jgi:curved DNA-binding protein CbpA
LHIAFMASQFPNYYQVLGLDNKACSVEEVRQAYRRESLR